MKKNFLVILVLLCAPCFAVTFEQAILDYQNKKFEKAYLGFEELSRLGNERAQYNISAMYARGDFLENDYVKALAWATLAQESGSDTAVNMIEIISKHLNDKQKKEALLVRDELNRTYGHLALEEKVFLSYSKGSSGLASSKPLFISTPDYPRIMARYARYGWVDVQFVTGKDGTARFFTVIYSPHDAFSASSLEAVRKSSLQAASFSNRNILDFVQRYRFNYQMAGSTVDAKVLLPFLERQKTQAEIGSSQDKFNFAFELSGLRSILSGMKGGKDIVWESPMLWYQKAAQDGSILAKYELGINALRGEQCDMDKNKSLFWLTSAAKENLLDAQMALGYEYLTGLRFALMPEKGLQMIKTAAEKGLDHAQVLYAWFLVTLPDSSLRAVDEAEKIFALVDESEYVDQRSYYETSAALALAKQDWKSATRSIKKLSKLNKKYKVNTDREDALLLALNEKRMYLEQP